MCNAGTIQSETQQHACIATHSIRVHILSDHPECEVRNDRSTMSRSVDVIAPMDDANERWDPSSPRKGFAFCRWRCEPCGAIAPLGEPRRMRGHQSGRRPFATRGACHRAALRADPVALLRVMGKDQMDCAPFQRRIALQSCGEPSAMMVAQSNTASPHVRGRARTRGQRSKAQSYFCLGSRPFSFSMSLMFIFMPPGMMMSPGFWSLLQAPSHFASMIMVASWAPEVPPSECEVLLTV